MIYMNKVFFVGNLTTDPEMQSFGKEGKEFAKFCLATSKPGFNGKIRKLTPIYVEVCTFGKSAEYCKNNLHKGDTVFIDGELNYRSWKDPLGEVKNSLNVLAINVTAVTKRGSTGAGSEQETSAESPTSVVAPRAVDNAYGPGSDSRSLAGEYSEADDVEDVLF